MNNEQMEEIKRHFGVVAEGLEHKIQLVAEGVTNLDEKLDREMDSLRHEMRTEFAEVKSMIKFSYTELDRRIRVLEGFARTQNPRGALGESAVDREKRLWM